MTSNEKLDRTLNQIFELKGNFDPTEIQTKEMEEIKQDGYLNQILKKLENDGYIMRYDNKKDNDDVLPNNNPVTPKYEITFEGLVFKESGGYTNEAKQKEIEVNRGIALNYAIAIGTALGGLAGLYALIQMIEWIFC